MSQTITDKLIERAGFSNTFERERLGLLVKLVALHCIESYMTCKSIYDTTQQLETEFNVTAKSHDHE